MKWTKIVLGIMLWLTFNGCNHPEKKNSIVSHFHAKVYQIDARQFGYDIYKDSTRTIHQPIIPGAQGNIGFSSENDAKKVAELMIYKLDHGIIPPSISIGELDSLKIAK